METIVSQPVPLVKGYESDAGFDLHVAETYQCEGFDPIQIKYVERFQLPPGKMAYLVGRSSSHKRGILSTGVIDAGYCGPLSSTFLPFEDMVIPKGMKIAQVVVHDIPNVKFEVGEFVSTQRGEASHGSSGLF